ncbi:MAG: ATP-binding protein [Defluviitaleaceae bacterium]|nr:ATP-binding protein [Defluviitaleaceae bacterium]
MSYKTVTKEVLKYYETAKNKADKLYNTRRQEVLSKLPRLQEIEDEIATISLSVSKQILAKQGDAATLIGKIKKKQTALKAEKQAILAKNNIPEDYFTNIYECNLCKDTGYTEKPAKNTKDYRCSCLKQRIINKYYDLSNLKEILQNENFDKFDVEIFDDQEILSNGFTHRQYMEGMYKIAAKFVETFDETFENIFFTGKTGTGKTFLTNCIAKDLLDKGKIVLYFTAPKLFSSINDYQFKQDYKNENENPAETAVEVDLLIIDDLGIDLPTSLTISALFDIINQRILLKKSTIISSNISMQNIEENYSQRIASRIMGNYKPYQLYGNDVRVAKNKPKNGKNGKNGKD